METTDSPDHLPDTVVLVDDSNSDRMLLDEWVKRAGADIKTVSFADPSQALKWLSTNAADLVITDYRMPGMNGIEFVKAFRALPGAAQTQIIMVTSVEDPRVLEQALQCSVADFFHKPLNEQSVKARVVTLLTIHRQVDLLRSRAMPIEKQLGSLVNDAYQRERRLLLAFSAIGKRHYSARLRTNVRLSKFAGVLAAQYPLTADAIANLELAVPLCDVGNIAVSPEIFQQSTALSHSQTLSMRSHTEQGAQILSLYADHKLPYLDVAAEIALAHHENFDGSGYPKGLSGERIPHSARLCAVVDSLDAMLTDRPYRRAMLLPQAMEEIQSLSGKRFCPIAVEALTACTDKISEVVSDILD